MWQVPTLDSATSRAHMVSIRDSKKDALAVLANWGDVIRRLGEMDSAWPDIRALQPDPRFEPPPDVRTEAQKEDKNHERTSTPLRKQLNHMYSGDTDAMSVLETAIRSLGVPDRRGKCPYCGISAPETLDHQLPKHVYPEYATYGRNLIPTCGACNNRKHEAGWAAHWLPAVEDPSLMPPLIKVQLTRDGPLLSASFEVEDDPTLPMTSRIKHTCGKLELARQWELRAPEILNRRRLEILSGESSLEQARRTMEIAAMCCRETFGPNHYESALLAAASTSDVFFDWVFPGAVP